MSSFDLVKFLTENKLTPNSQGCKIILDENRKRVNLSESADLAMAGQLPPEGSPDRDAWFQLWKSITSFTRSKNLNVRKVVDRGQGNIRIIFKDDSVLTIGPGVLTLTDRTTHERVRVSPANAAEVCEKFDSVGVRHVTYADPKNRRTGAMNDTGKAPLHEDASQEAESGIEEKIKQAVHAQLIELLDTRWDEFGPEPMHNALADQVTEGEELWYAIPEFEGEVDGYWYGVCDALIYGSVTDSYAGRRATYWEPEEWPSSELWFDSYECPIDWCRKGEENNPDVQYNKTTLQGDLGDASFEYTLE